MTTAVKRWIVFSTLVLVSVTALRSPILLRSVIDWDESVYLLVASSVIEGSLPYVEVWSHKQPFLFVLLTSSFLCPDPVVGSRLVGCLCIAATAIFLAFMIRRLAGGWVFPALAASLYVLATLAPGGLATNSEILFAPFVAAAFAVLAHTQSGEKHGGRRARTRFFSAGLLSGFAVQIKLVAAFEVLALGVSSVVAWWPRDDKISRAVGRTMRRGWWFGLGLLIPLVTVVLAFWKAGRLEEYAFANFGFNLAYTNLDVNREVLIRAVVARQAAQGNLILFVVALVGGLWLLLRGWRMKEPATSSILAGVAWLGAAGISVFAAAKFYDHHVIQIVPPAVYLATAAIATLSKGRIVVCRVLAVFLAVGLIGTQVVHGRRAVARAVSTPDVSREVSRYVEDRIEPGEVIYVANGQPIIYLLAGAKPPTRYIQPAWIIRPEFRRRLGLDIDVFLDQVFAHRPTFVILEQDQPWLPDGRFVDRLVRDYLDGRYEPVARFDSVIVFRVIRTEDR